MTYKLCIVSASKRNPKHLPYTEHTNQCRNLYYCHSLHIGKKRSHFGKIFINSDSYCNSWVCYARWRFAYNKMAARTPSIVLRWIIIDVRSIIPHVRICESVYEGVLKIFRPDLLSETWPTDQTIFFFVYEKTSLVGIEKFPAPPSMNQWAISVKLLPTFMSRKIYAYFKHRKKKRQALIHLPHHFTGTCTSEHLLSFSPFSSFYDFKHAIIFVPLWLTSKKDKKKKALPFCPFSSGTSYFWPSSTANWKQNPSTKTDLYFSGGKWDIVMTHWEVNEGKQKKKCSTFQDFLSFFFLVGVIFCLGHQWKFNAASDCGDYNLSILNK